MIFWDHLVVVGVRAFFGAFAPGAGVWLLSEFVLFAVLSQPGLGSVSARTCSMIFCNHLSPDQNTFLFFKNFFEMFLTQTVNCF